MTGIFQLADLTIQVEGSMEELVEAQGVEREFSRACRKIRKAANDADVQILLDKNLQSDEGREFSKIRLRAYANGKNYTIDCGSTDENILGVYVPWEAPVEVYDRETETVKEVKPLANSEPDTAPSQEAADEPQEPPSERTGYDPDDPPDVPTGENDRLTRRAAVRLWEVAKDAGHTKNTFRAMLASIAGVEKPQMLHVEDWPQAWKYALDPAGWKVDYEYAEERELPLD